MNRIINKISLTLIMLLPAAAFAYDSPSVEIIDPKTDDVPTLINSVIDWVLVLVIGVTTLFIVIGGFKYVTSAGNKEQAESAKKTLTYAIIGLIIVILAKIIISLVSNSVDKIL